MAGRRLSAVDTMRAIAWCHEVQTTSGLSVEQLKEFAFDDGTGKNAAVQEWDFTLYASGMRRPSARTRKLVEKAFPATSKVFDKGMEGAPLWELLSDACHEATCFDAVDWWLNPHDDHKKRHAATLALPFLDKVEAAWRRLVHPSALVDYLDYAQGEQPNAVSRDLREILAEEEWLERKSRKAGVEQQADRRRELARSRMTALADLDTIVGVLALWRIAEHRGEKRSEARYLYDGILPSVPYVFAEWGIGGLLHEFLEKHRLPCDPVADILHGAIKREARRQS